MTKAVPWSPRDYQLKAVEWLLSHPKGGLLLDPGLGKTSSTLAAVDVLKRQAYVHHVLVVAPLRVAQTVWPVEAEKWKDFQHLTVCDLTEKTREQRVRWLKEKYDIYVINPESLVKILDLDPWKYVNLDMLVIDESTKFKDSTTQRFKALKKCLHRFARRVILTGTPAPNGLADLFGQMYVCDMGESLGKYITHFRQRYMYQSRDGFSWLLAPGADQRIYEKVKYRLLRMMAVDHLDMPELINNYINVKLAPAVMSKYKEMEKNFLVQIADDTVVAFNTAALGVKCRQIANGFVYNAEHDGLFVHKHKLEALEELVEEMQGRPLLLCYEFIEDANVIEAAFPQAVNISKVKNVLQTVKAFNEGKIPLLIGHPKSMGHGLNLQEMCHDICWYGITWDLELYLQAIARVWRQGQPSSFVMCHHIVAEDTLDEEVIKRLAVKDASQNALNNALKTLAQSRV